MKMIRPAFMHDLEKVSALWVSMVREEYGESATPDVELWIKMFSDKMVHNEHFSMLVAEDDGVLIGYISGEVYAEPSDGKIHGISQSIYVMPKYRNGSMGLGLYHELAKIFTWQGAQVIEFLCKPERIPFWNKKGYQCHAVVMSMDARELSKAYDKGKK